MQIAPEIAALRSDKPAQRQLRQIMEAAHSEWRAPSEVGEVLADLARFAAGEPLSRLGAMGRLMRGPGAAQGFVKDWCRAFLQVLARVPLAQVPLRHHHRAGYSWMQLASHGGATLSLAVYEELADPPPARSAVFSDREQHELVLAGRASAICHRIVATTPDHAHIASEARALAAGDVMTCAGEQAARRIEAVEGRLVLLQLTRVPEAPGLTREYALPSGVLLKQSSGDKRTSQREMAMAVLVALDRHDAAQAIALHANAGPEHLRWEALRHTLALDARAGSALLARIARSPNDPLAAPALELQAQLQAAYPPFALLKESPCPA